MVLSQHCRKQENDRGLTVIARHANEVETIERTPLPNTVKSVPDTNMASSSRAAVAAADSRQHTQ